jgi:hypothetical protein
MNSEDLMYLLESIAYISASLAAFVYIWETCFLNKIKKIKRRYNSSDLNIQEEQRRLSSSGSSNMYDDDAFKD